MPVRSDIVTVRPDGNRIFMVMLELCVLIYTLIYAFPSYPTALVDETGLRRQFGWLGVSSTESLRNAVRDLLRTSDVLEASRRTLFPDAPNEEAAIDELAAVATPRTLSARYGLNLFHDGVPSTARQMVDYICSVYGKLYTMDIATREDLVALLRLHQFIPTTFRLKMDDARATKIAGVTVGPTLRTSGTLGATGVGGGNITRPSLLSFCAEHAVEWMQPYFARDVNFYVPAELRNEVFVAADLHRSNGRCAAAVKPYVGALY
jgi:hypothetical protein